MIDVCQMGARCALGLALLSPLALAGCYGQGGVCTADEAPGVMEEAKDMGILTPSLTAIRGELLAQGILQWQEDEDWYRFTVKDSWFVRWTPTISLVVLPAPGSGIVEASYAVNVYTEDGIFVGDASQGLTLRGTSFYDDTRPYYVQIRWRRPARAQGEPRTSTPTDDASTLGQTPSPSPREEVASPSPSPSLEPTAAPELGELCTRYVLRVRN